MSFRNRLRLFFLMIVVAPMLVVAVVLYLVTFSSESGKADSDVNARTQVARKLNDEAHRQALIAGRAIANDVPFATAIRRNDAEQLQTRASDLLRRRGVQRIVVARGTNRALVDVGNAAATFPATINLVDGGHRFGRLEVSTATPREYANQVKRTTGLETVVSREGGEVLASTLPGAAKVDVPETRKASFATVNGRKYRTRAFRAPGFLGGQVKVSLFASRAALTQKTRERRIEALAAIAAFLLIAISFGLLISRSLQSQMGRFLAAAQRVGGGDFSEPVPTEGNDEFAQLGVEFNRMSDQLQARLRELQIERKRLQEAMGTLGETFASNLDREALLEIVVRAAVDGVDADAGRASVRPTLTDPLEQVALTGSAKGLSEAIRAAEANVLETGEPSDAQVDDVSALSHPLRRDEHQARVSGVVTVARKGIPFSPEQRELFHYLAGQAAVSIENVGLHETVERQAVTDELTGLFNRRRFQEAMTTEVERARRFNQPLGLVLLDIDNFKQVNDALGHDGGDGLLRTTAERLKRVLGENELAARLGGDEFAVLIPELHPGRDVHDIAQAILAGMREPFIYEG